MTVTATYTKFLTDPTSLLDVVFSGLDVAGVALGLGTPELYVKATGVVLGAVVGAACSSLTEEIAGEEDPLGLLAGATLCAAAALYVSTSVENRINSATGLG